MGLPPPPKSLSFMLIPPFVEDAVQIIFPVCTSIIFRLKEIILPEVAPDLVSPYSLKTPVITASTFRIFASFMISSVDGTDGLLIPALEAPRATSPGGST